MVAQKVDKASPVVVDASSPSVKTCNRDTQKAVAMSPVAAVSGAHPMRCSKKVVAPVAAQKAGRTSPAAVKAGVPP
jgi:hypothetical protein